MPQLSRKRKSVTWRKSVLPRRKLAARAFLKEKVTIQQVAAWVGRPASVVQGVIDGTKRDSAIAIALWSVIEMAEGPLKADAFLVGTPLA